jgi:hypothetical protein
MAIDENVNLADPEGYGDDERDPPEQELDTEGDQAELELDSPDDEGSDENGDLDTPPRRTEEAAPKRSRATEAVLRAKAEASAAREAAERATAELAALRNQQTSFQDAERKRIERANMDPDEAWRQDANDRLTQYGMQIQDANDRAEFTTFAAGNPVAARMLAKVEADLKVARSRGVNPNRHAVLLKLLGEEALERESKAPKLREQGKKRVQEARGSSPGMRSNVSSSGGKGDKSLAERLKDVPL